MMLLGQTWLSAVQFSAEKNMMRYSYLALFMGTLWRDTFLDAESLVVLFDSNFMFDSHIYVHVCGVLSINYD